VQPNKILPGGSIAADAAAHKRKCRLIVVQLLLPGPELRLI
jgi:hypothetical protein